MAVVSKLNNLVELAREKSSERRRTLLREVTDLFFEETPDSGSATSRKFDELLSSLAEQTAQDAREELSQRFADAPQAPRGLVLQLAQDAIEVAAPMLARSRVLTDEDLLSIAETAEQGHLKAMSRREEVCERLSDTIVRRGDDETVAQLIRNDGARLSRETFETVTERAESSPVLQGPLVERGDTPNDLLADLMLTVGNSLRERIMERFDAVDPAVLEHAMAASKARLAQRMAEDRDIAAAQKFVQTMALRKQLTGNLLARLLREREYSKFYAAFAEMTGVDYVAARRAIKQESIDPLALICKSAGFDKALFVTLAVLRHAAGEDAFRDARELGQLYDAISADDAARAMRFWRMRKNMAA
ncbi:MAG: hypothetical protein CMH94_03585 [Oceanicaulis sp.]|uniref:DUF2336 domain-containing protein n=1 Tax=Maricaulis virginensis TaxID=144022 RepID=A0A9W6MMC8_9PROT|nr:DUF2336 domain-containing protein [Maricaulis virginensis]MAZ91688.1 hypothetical protein [Maricaulis sp.]MBI74663.1 hypothetical protein [Oceanicaulis sp.]GLK50684.1 hypothetical protein GCM10017621_01920 [Maricaulis virginensis]